MIISKPVPFSPAVLLPKASLEVRFAIAVMLILAFLISGCASMLTSKTTVNVKTVDGTKTCEASYTSDKEQEGMDATICGGKIKTLKSGTLESVVEGITELQKELAGILSKLTDAAKTGAMSGS